jgi:hypothetical protein
MYDLTCSNMSGPFYFMFYIASIIPEFDIKEDILELYVLEQLAGYVTYNTNSRGENRSFFHSKRIWPILYSQRNKCPFSVPET